VWRKPFITGKKQKAVFEEEIREFHTSAVQDIGEFKQKCNILNIDEMHLHGKPTQARNVIVTMAFAKSGRPIYKFLLQCGFSHHTCKFNCSESSLMLYHVCVFQQVMCITVTGYFVPPVIIFEGEDIDPEAVKAWEEFKASAQHPAISPTTSTPK